MNRRIFLRGLGGAVVAAPFLGSLGNRSAKAQPAATPKRLIVMFTHYGCVTTRFFPTKSHGVLSKADLDTTTLKHLSPYVDKLLIPRGIRGMNEWNPAMVRGQGNDPDLQVCGSYFTCQPVTPNSDDPFSFESATKFNAMPMGPSLDHVIAKQLSPQGQPLLLSVSGQTVEQAASAISYSAAETKFTAQSVKQAFAGLTGLFSDGAMSPDTYQAVRGKSVIDLVRDDLNTLERFDLSQSDKTKLEAWKQLLTDTSAVVSKQCTREAGARFGATQANVDALGKSSPGSDVLEQAITDALDAADIYSAVATLAALCNSNPVIFLKYPGNFIFSGLGLSIDSHSLSMRLNNASMQGVCVPNAIEMLLKIDDYYARKFATLVGMLDGIDEDDGTLLDNTATVWFQEVSDGAAHNLNNLPIIQAGSAGGYFKTGWTVNVEDGSPNLTTGRSEAVCGDDAPIIDGTSQATGTDPKWANAPINKYYCNLMNALGVKAGADGFPAPGPGGTEEVVRFGRYDKTEDFVGGGTKPPKINDPGGFDALRAKV
ncbi:MAG: DUF1552 domain-containing protein [Polyangiaceae bacterium]